MLCFLPLKETSKLILNTTLSIFLLRKLQLDLILYHVESYFFAGISEPPQHLTSSYHPALFLISPPHTLCSGHSPRCPRTMPHLLLHPRLDSRAASSRSQVLYIRQFPENTTSFMKPPLTPHLFL